MSNKPVIELGDDGRPVREPRSPLAGRRLLVAAILAIAEVVAIIVWDPSLILVLLASMALAVLAFWGAFRLVKRGFVRDVLLVIGLSQLMVVAIPVALGISFLAALVLGVLLLVGVVLLIARSRF